MAIPAVEVGAAAVAASSCPKDLTILSNQRWLATSLALLMFTFLVYGYPATWRCATDPSWCSRAAPWIRANLLPPELVCTRFIKEPIFNYGHLMIGGLWTLAAPIQLSPWIRAKAPGLHRWSGRLMLLSATSMSAAILYWEAKGHLADQGLHAWTFYRIIYPIFIGSMVMCGVAARQRRYQTHAEWALRHVAAGMPFAWGRVLPTLFSGFVIKAGLLDPTNPVHAYLTFWSISYASLLASFGICEWTILRARQQGKASKVA